MGAPPEPPAWMAAAARNWLEDAGATAEGGAGQSFNALPLSGVRVSLAERGRAVCSLRVPPHLTDAEGNWHTGAIAAAADDVCAAAIMSVEGIIKVSVHYDISYFSPAKLHEEVEMDGKVVEHKGRMTAVTVEIRKKESGELVAIVRQIRFRTARMQQVNQPESTESEWERREGGRAMGDEARAPRPATVARKWLEDPGGGHGPVAAAREEFTCLVMAGARVSVAEPGRVVCSLRVRAPLAVGVLLPARRRTASIHPPWACTWPDLTSFSSRAAVQDAEGRWHAGAVAAAVDNVCAAVVFSVEGEPSITVDYALSYFAPARHDEEVELEGRVAGRNGQLTAAEVEVRSKDSGELLAIGRQWMTALPSKTSRSSKL
ncbi:hypothetical protein HU200_066753 [Digitaria exilis]|uniref:Thioesterase domain-containing protein n=1 Tax=Digitaria exilis TaxID=1010633 RepID=A0A835A756_9POAL|nr:hypothetical protein HU200_066753 [Digitaria exilis]